VQCPCRALSNIAQQYTALCAGQHIVSTGVISIISASTGLVCESGAHQQAGSSQDNPLCPVWFHWWRLCVNFQRRSLSFQEHACDFAGLCCHCGSPVSRRLVKNQEEEGGGGDVTLRQRKGGGGGRTLQPNPAVSVVPTKEVPFRHTRPFYGVP
jgi:hypothetical protein